MISSDLRGDCARCVGLCCVVPAFARSADFALDKPAGVACPHLDVGHRCGIHPVLRDRGFAGCVTYDCFGAGQQVTAVYGGVAAAGRPDAVAAMRAAFPTARHLHELAAYLAEASALTLSADLRAVVAELTAANDALIAAAGARDLSAHHTAVADALGTVSREVRSDLGTTAELRAHDLTGADLAARDLTGVELRGALLLGADLRGARLVRADLLGADLRGARLERADLTDALFVTAPQLRSAHGDASTRLPAGAERPAHWT